MPIWRNRLSDIIYGVELIVFISAGYLGRGWLDRATAELSPAWVIILLKLILLAALIGIAVVVHTLLERYLRARGIIK